jgi:hypothetical protein
MFSRSHFFVPGLWMVLFVAAAFPSWGAGPPEGFGAGSRGGKGGRTILVTRLDDQPKKPVQGSLRWALRQKGPRMIKFAVGGTIKLHDRIEVRESFVTVDGGSAPNGGITITGGSLEFRGASDVILRHLRLRLGDENILKAVKSSKRSRPRSSQGLDCLSLNNCRRVLIDRCSLSWSADELIGITQCRDVTVQWCILSEPLSNPRIHPYGDEHAFGINASASTLSIHHCLFAHFVMRGPQFECNDMGSRDKFTVQMEAVNNVIFDYQRSGSRFVMGVEKGSGVEKGKRFQFQFLHNLYIARAGNRPPIEASDRYGTAKGLQVGVVGNEVLAKPGPLRIAGMDIPLLMMKDPLIPRPKRDVAIPNLSDDLGDVTGPRGARLVPLPEKSVARHLFAAPVPVRIEPVATAWKRVLDEAGAGPDRDEVDTRVVQSVRDMEFCEPLRSQGRR